jgi:Fe-S cluster assembly protein SufD
MAGYEQYAADFETLEETASANGSTWLRDVRKDGLAAFERLGFPTERRGNERWKYTNVAPIARATFAYPFDADADAVTKAALKEQVPWSDDWARLVFVDGRFSESLSTPRDVAGGLRLKSLGAALHSDGDLIREHLGELAPSAEDGFTAVNTAFLGDGALVHLPLDAANEAVVHLIWVTTERAEPIATYPRALIVAGRHSRLRLVESYVGTSGNFTDAVVEMVIDEGAEIEHYRYLAEDDAAFHIGTTRVRVGRDATFNSTSFARGAKIARNDLNVLLDEEGGSCFLNGLYMTSGRQHIDNHIDIDHAKPHTSSDQYFKGVVDGQSRAVFSGRVLVRKNAQKTYAKQSDKNLLLSRGARINTKPSLEIYADDVQCFHGATAGAVADDALFYMRSRGIDEETATTLLVYGFAREIIERVRLEPLRDHLDRLFSGTMAEGRSAAASPQGFTPERDPA